MEQGSLEDRAGLAGNNMRLQSLECSNDQKSLEGPEESMIEDAEQQVESIQGAPSAFVTTSRRHPAACLPRAQLLQSANAVCHCTLQYSTTDLWELGTGQWPLGCGKRALAQALMHFPLDLSNHTQYTLIPPGCKNDRGLVLPVLPSGRCVTDENTQDFYSSSSKKMTTFHWKFKPFFRASFSANNILQGRTIHNRAFHPKNFFSVSQNTDGHF